MKTHDSTVPMFSDPGCATANKQRELTANSQTSIFSGYCFSFSQSQSGLEPRLSDSQFGVLSLLGYPHHGSEKGCWKYIVALVETSEFKSCSRPCNLFCWYIIHWAFGFCAQDGSSFLNEKERMSVFLVILGVNIRVELYSTYCLVYCWTYGGTQQHSQMRELRNRPP